jgi:hypothetical protein
MPSPIRLPRPSSFGRPSDTGRPRTVATRSLSPAPAVQRPRQHLRCPMLPSGSARLPRPAGLTARFLGAAASRTPTAAASAMAARSI